MAGTGSPVTRILIPVTSLLLICAAPAILTGEQQNSSRLYRQAAKLAQSGNRKDAIVLFRKVIQLSPYYTKGHYGLGKALLYQKSTVPEGILHLKKAVFLDRRNSAAFFYLGMGYMMSNNYMKAIESFQKAYRMDPNRTEALYNIGAVFDIMENKKQSTWYFRQYLEKQHREDSDILF